MRPSNLHLKHHTYYLRIRVPARIRHLIRKKELKLSLSTTSYKEACYRILDVKKLIWDFFTVADSLVSQSITKVMEDHIHAELQSFYSHSIADFKYGLHAPDTERIEQIRRELHEERPFIEIAIKALELGDYSNDWLAGETYEFSNTLPEGMLEPVNITNPNYRHLAKNVAQVRIKLFHAKNKLLHRYFPGAEVIRIRPKVRQGRIKHRAVKTQSISTQEAVDRFLTERRDTGAQEKSITEYRTVLNRMVDALDNPSLENITRNQIREFRNNLKLYPKRAPRITPKPSFHDLVSQEHADTLSIESINKHLNRASALFKWAIREEIGLDKNPAEGLEINNPIKASDQRSRFSEVQIKAIFSTDYFTGKKSFSQSAHYWVPLIGLYTGARIEEISQMDICDIKLEESIWTFSINDTGGKTLKTKSSNRTIPIHSKLIKLGLISYVERLKNAGHQRLFPTLIRHERNGYSHNVGKWFSKLKSGLGFKATTESFHSFRHSLADELKQKEVEESIIAAIIGHSYGGITSNRYGKSFKVETLQKHIEKIRFDIQALCFSEVKLTTTEERCLDSVKLTENRIKAKLRQHRQ